METKIVKVYEKKIKTNGNTFKVLKGRYEDQNGNHKVLDVRLSENCNIGPLPAECTLKDSDYYIYKSKKGFPVLVIKSYQDVKKYDIPQMTLDDLIEE